MAQVKFEDLLGTGAHFGHVTRKWDPNFKPYILLEKNGVHIINLESTIESIEKTLIDSLTEAKISQEKSLEFFFHTIFFHLL